MKNHVYHTYILQCSDLSYYTGVTNHLEERVKQHNEGFDDHDDESLAYTRSRRPVKLVYAELFKYIEDAIKREKQIQGWSRAKKEALIAGDIPRLKALSRCANLSRHTNFEYDRGLVANRPKNES